jgi:hypothetical protein
VTGRELRTVWVTLVVEVAGRLSFKVRALPWRRLPRLVAEVVVAKGWLPGTTATEEVAVEKPAKRAKKDAKGGSKGDAKKGREGTTK